ncbi:MAG: sulfatase [Acidobacteriota bacterium]
MKSKWIPAVLPVLLLVVGACSDTTPPVVDDDSILSVLATGHFVGTDAVVDLPRLAANEDPAARWQLGEGWGRLETWGAWTIDEHAEAWVRVARVDEPLELYLECRTLTDDGPAQSVTVRVNDTEIGTVELEPDWQDYRLEVPADVARVGANHIELIHGRTFSIDTDARALAVGVKLLGLVPRGSRPESSERPGAVVDGERDAVVFQHTGTWVAPWRVPNDVASLVVEPRANDGSWRLEIRDLDGEATELARGDANTPEEPVSVDVSAWRDRTILLTLHAEVGKGGRVTLRAPRIERGAGKEPPTRLVTPEVEPRPNIIMVVLDALHADHVGVYGYERATTPVIDGLAAQGIAFEQIIAECPYTLCSTPNFLTGMSFVRHGLVERGLALDASIDTLAERLDRLGYTSIGISANPNNSVGTFTVQGFDEWHEIWQIMEGRDRTHPGGFTELALERVAAVDDDTPVFLMLHYVPPHEPYDPDPEFDIFGDPAYAGSITPDRAMTRDIYAGRIQLDDADLAELVSLYDGNLLMADHWVGRLVDGLEQDGRLDRSWVIVTSDHGEAFGQHGAVGHNTQIYEPMVHVPLVMRPPVGVDVSTVDATRVANVGSMVPTLLGLLGSYADAAAAQGDGAIDLFTDIGSQPVFLRTGHPGEKTIWGVRTERYKAIRTPDGAQLFDVIADPDETVDVARDEPVMWTGLMALLDMARAEGGVQAGERTEAISDEERKALESLGYM